MAWESGMGTAGLGMKQKAHRVLIRLWKALSCSWDLESMCGGRAVCLGRTGAGPTVHLCLTLKLWTGKD